MAINRFTDLVKAHAVDYLKKRGFKQAAFRLSYKKGLPPGIPQHIVETFLTRRGDAELVGVRHCHLSGWKDAGSYRIVLKRKPRGAISLVFKNAKYSEVDIPALSGLPVVPGLAEYFFFTRSRGPASKFLPEVYQAEEVTPKRHYRYLMQDLSVDHRTFAGTSDLAGICGILPRLHEALLASATRDGSSPLIRYDREFDGQLIDYAYLSLKSYQAQHADLEVERLLSGWDEFLTHYEQSSKTAYTLQPLTVIHGDYNTSNVMIHRRNNSVRAYDLEWAGWGLPHSDLVSALLNAPQSLEGSYLTAFHKSLARHTLEEDRLIFRHAKLQRALLNASFVAKQYLCAQGYAPTWFPRFISNASRNVLQGVEGLKRQAT